MRSLCVFLLLLRLILLAVDTPLALARAMVAVCWEWATEVIAIGCSRVI
jgi:hypothetical protein